VSESMAIPELERIYFKFDSHSLDDEAKRIIRQNVVWLQAKPDIKIFVEGHCDMRGSDAYNLILGEKRAKAATAYLLTLGIAADRISVISFGEEKPLDSTPGKAAAAKNRRVEFVQQ